MAPPMDSFGGIAFDVVRSIADELALEVVRSAVGASLLPITAVLQFFVCLSHIQQKCPDAGAPSSNVCIHSMSWMQLPSNLKKLELAPSSAEHKNNVKVKHLLISDCGRTAFHLKPIIIFQAARPSSGSFKHYLGKHNRTSGITFCSTLSPHPLPC